MKWLAHLVRNTFIAQFTVGLEFVNTLTKIFIYVVVFSNVSAFKSPHMKCHRRSKKVKGIYRDSRKLV